MQALCWAPNLGENSELGANFRPKIGANQGIFGHFARFFYFADTKQMNVCECTCKFIT